LLDEANFTHLFWAVLRWFLGIIAAPSTFILIFEVSLVCQRGCFALWQLQSAGALYCFRWRYVQVQLLAYQLTQQNKNR
jgi:hypothetical protein